LPAEYLDAVTWLEKAGLDEAVVFEPRQPPDSHHRV
jgi:hypothetical protein